jgi:hypothetical protein
MRLDEIAQLHGEYCKVKTIRGEELFGRLTRLSHDAFELVEPSDERAVAWLYAREIASASIFTNPGR